MKALLLLCLLQTLTVFAADETTIAATKKSIGAQAKLEVFINLDGSVRDVAIRQSSGLMSFDDSAIDVLKKRKFQPNTTNGNAASSSRIVLVTQQIEEK
ncbi:MAG: TonB family protein [Bdellovibrio sp.]|nr:TonB family protein [Methylotenera sp.]